VDVAAVRDPHRVRASRARDVWYCSVDADGVPAQWVEATVATCSQPTYVYFRSLGQEQPGLPPNDWPPAHLALSTGARVLSVGWRLSSDDSLTTAIRDGLTAYRWLLGEGCDLTTTILMRDADTAPIVDAVISVSQDDRLPLPRVATDLVHLEPCR